jgi:fermentation-respiration switch protein FrsA (DUF1100 family)
MTIAILVLSAALLALHFFMVVAVAEISVHPPVMRRPCDTDGMALHVARAMGVTAELVRIQARDGVTLSAWWLRLPSSSRAVLTCHGVADTAFGVMGAALMFLRNGYSVLAPDNRGHGGSGGFVTYGVLEAFDIALWQSWLAGQGMVEMHGFGESLGASSLLQSFSAHAAFTTVVAECPFSSFQRVAFDRVLLMNSHFLPQSMARWLSNLTVKEILFYLRLRYGVDLKLSRPVDAVRQTRASLLLIHGSGDHETPVHHSEEMAAIHPERIQLWLVPGAQHTGGYAVDPAEFERKVMTLLKSGGTNQFGWESPNG